MKRRTLICVLIGIACGAASLWPAQSREVEGNPVPDMDDHTLWAKYHIPPTTDAWMGALRHERAEVRVLAAMRLASVGYKEAVPSILAAMSSDPLPGARVNQAAAAARLGSQDGVAALERMCQNSGWSPGMRMMAAYTALIVGSEGCLGEVLDVLRSREDDPATSQALHLITRFRHLTHRHRKPRSGPQSQPAWGANHRW
jgi:hypothetical protein